MEYPFDVASFIKENKDLIRLYLKKNTMNLVVEDIVLTPDEYYKNNEQLMRYFKRPRHELSELQKLEYIKCMKDVCYFTEKYGKVISVDDGIVPFRLYPYQKKLMKLYSNNRFVISTQARQSGKTQTTSAFILHYIIFNPSKNAGILANKMDQAQEIIERIQLTYEMLPFFIKGGVKYYNKRSLKLGNNSAAFAGSSGNGGIRGKSLSLVYWDEAAFTPRDAEFYESTYPVISSGKETRVIISSTPNGARGVFYKIFMEAKEGKNQFKYIEVPWHMVPGRGERWKKEQLANTTQEAFDQEQDLKFRGSQNSLISAAVLEKLYKLEPIQIVNNDLRIYEEPQKGAKYAMAVDSSRGVGGDYSAFIVFKIEKKKYTVVATYRNNRISPMLYPMLIHNVSKTYNDAITLVETNDIGEQVVNILFYDYESETVLRTFSEKGKAVVGFIKNAALGLRTTKSTKAIGVATVKTLIDRGYLILNDSTTIEEFGTFVPKGVSYEADVGSHDDMVMCCVLFAWLTTQQYFKDLMENDIGQFVRNQSNMDVDYDLMPFGIIDDGVEMYEPDMNHKSSGFWDGF